MRGFRHSATERGLCGLRRRIQQAARKTNVRLFPRGVGNNPTATGGSDTPDHLNRWQVFQLAAWSFCTCSPSHVCGVRACMESLSPFSLPLFSLPPPLFLLFFFRLLLSHCLIQVSYIHQEQSIHPHSHAVQLDFEKDILHKCIMVMCVWLYVLHVLRIN